MGLPAPLADALTDFGKIATQPAAAIDRARAAKEQFLASVEDIASRARSLKERYEHIREGLASFETSIRSETDYEVIDTAIAHLLELEQQLKNNFAPMVRRVRATNKGLYTLASVRPTERARAITVTEYYIKTLTETLELLRDTRWRLMTRRAEFEDSGDAPVFDDPEKLVQYLHDKSSR
jgi:exonuclease VII large subunit